MARDFEVTAVMDGPCSVNIAPDGASGRIWMILTDHGSGCWISVSVPASLVRQLRRDLDGLKDPASAMGASEHSSDRDG